jgi:hypothetical protein
MSRIRRLRIGVAAAWIATHAAVCAAEELEKVVAGTLGVYADSAGTEPCATVDQFATLYVIARVAGASAAGITGAEFRIEVEKPSGWSFSYSPPPAADIRMGDPMDLDPQKSKDESGLRIAFATCREPVQGKIDLGTIVVIRDGGATTYLRVKRHSKPSNSKYACALFTLCDSPVYSKACVSAARDSCGPQESTASDAAVFVTELKVAPQAR